jgi:hydrogenase nickel incorporation protein HypA/HybF
LHELGIAAEILDIALSEADRHQANKVTEIRLRVGVLRAVEPEHLSFMFGHLARGTLADGALLSVEEAPVQVECASCGVYESFTAVWACPRCNGFGIDVKGGDSLDIISIDICK